MELSREQSARHTGHLPLPGAAAPEPSPRGRGQPEAVLQAHPAPPSALQGHFTLLTLAGVWGLSMRRLMGVRGALP